MSEDKYQKKIQEYFEVMKELQEAVLSFLQMPKDDCYLGELIKIFNKCEIARKRQIFQQFLRMITNISDNYHRDAHFFDKIKDILLFLELSIKQTFSNSDIFKIFKSNKLILLFLIEQKILIVNETIVKYILKEQSQNGIKYCYFFVPEIKEFIDTEKLQEIEKEIKKFDKYYPNNYNKKRHQGENDDNICVLIRNDSIEEFIQYYNRPNKKEFGPSIYETNSFLIDKNPTLIEYSTFFSSIQIFNFLKMNNVQMNPSLWFYVIHSKNPEFIHILEELFDFNWEVIILESIKCHHNEFVEYVLNSIDFEFSIDVESDVNEKIVSTCFEYSNYAYFPENFDKNFGFFNLCKYEYTKIVKLYLKSKRNEIKNRLKTSNILT